VHLYVSPPLGILPQYQSKELKILGVSSPQRLTILPEVPTFAEQGIDFKRFGWLGVCAGAGTPQPIIDLLNRHITTIVAGPEYQTLIETAGSIPVSSSPAEVNNVLKQTVDDVAATIREYGMQQE